METIKKICWYCNGEGFKNKLVFTKKEQDIIKELHGAGLSGRNIAKKLGVNHQYVNEYLSGGQHAKDKKLDKIKK